MHIVKIFFYAIMIAAVVFSESMANDSKNAFKDVFDNANRCKLQNNYKDNPFLCYIKAAPHKCENEMIEFLSSAVELRDNAQRKLFICIATCAEASIYSRTFGECSREKY